MLFHAKDDFFETSKNLALAIIDVDLKIIFLDHHTHKIIL